MRARGRGRDRGRARAWINIPERLRSEQLRGNLHTPEHDPGCEIPPDNTGTVIVRTVVDGEGRHSLVRAWAEGGRIDHDVLQAYVNLVVRVWSSAPLEYRDGTRCDLRDGETLGLEVAFPVAAGRGYGVGTRAT